MQPPAERQEGEPSGGLLSRSFLALLATQFLVSWNDNMFRWLIVPIGKDLIGTDLALALGGALFLLPFVLFTSWAGYLADRFSKRSVIVGCKVAEIAIMSLGVAAILSGNVTWMLSVLFLMGVQSAVFSPSKYGSIPEIVRHDRISAANGWIGMTTMLAVIMGTVAGAYLYDWTTLDRTEPGQYRWWISATALIGVAVAGWLVSLFMGRLVPANPARAFPRNPVGQTGRDLAALVASRPLLLAAVGSAFFWSLGVLAQMNIDKFARPDLVEDQQYVGYLLAIMTLGIGVGSILAGFWSRGHIEVGLVPAGAGGMAVALFLLATVPAGDGQPFSAAYLWAGGWLLGLGVAAGLYDIPLLAFLQDRAERRSRGRVLAAYNFLAFSGMLVASGVFWLLAVPLDLSARQIFLVGGLAMAATSAIAFWIVPLSAIRVAFGVLVRLLYRVRVHGLENVPTRGGAILVCNHISWLDGLLFGYCCPRRIHLVADVRNLKAPFIRRLARDGGVIQFSPDQRRSVIQTVRNVREQLQQGRLIGIFPEGGISRTGQILGFSAGFLTMLKGTGAPVVPVSLYGLWGSIFSFEGGRFFTKCPRLRRLPISVDFGEPIYDPADVQTVRRAVQRLATRASLRPEHQPLAPPRQLLRACRNGRIKIADAEGQRLTGTGLLTRALLLRRLLHRTLKESTVGVVLPASVPAVVVNAALALDRRVAVNLDPRLPDEALARRAAVADVRCVLTSRRLFGRPALGSLDVLHLEDLQATAGGWDRTVAWVQARLVPAALTERILRLRHIQPDDVLAVLFADDVGSRAVQLTQRNIASNVSSCGDVLHVGASDVLLGVAPFWRSDGFTLSLWSSLLRNHRSVFVDEAREFQKVGALCREHGVTVLVAPPQMLEAYANHIEPEAFGTLQLVMTCGRGFSMEQAEVFQARFGVKPFAGYGQPELSPVATMNAPARRPGWRRTWREGSVGWPLPGVTARIVDPETWTDLGVEGEGLLLVAGPNVMRGYLDGAGQGQEKIAPVLADGWFVTGMRGRIDKDGFLHLSR